MVQKPKVFQNSEPPKNWIVGILELALAFSSALAWHYVAPRLVRKAKWSACLMFRNPCHASKQSLLTCLIKADHNVNRSFPAGLKPPLKFLWWTAMVAESYLHVSGLLNCKLGPRFAQMCYSSHLVKHPFLAAAAAAAAVRPNSFPEQLGQKPLFFIGWAPQNANNWGSLLLASDATTNLPYHSLTYATTYG